MSSIFSFAYLYISHNEYKCFFNIYKSISFFCVYIIQFYSPFSQTLFPLRRTYAKFMFIYRKRSPSPLLFASSAFYKLHLLFPISCRNNQSPRELPRAL